MSLTIIYISPYSTYKILRFAQDDIKGAQDDTMDVQDDISTYTVNTNTFQDRGLTVTE